MCKISVVMCTYNGQKYIREQMESILNQTRKPDEVIISDDGSNDNTVSIINKFVREHNLKNWKININSKNVGWKKNFYDAICKASGDVIFMCDQDDIWAKRKIEIMANIMLQRPEILCLVGKSAAIDKQGNISSKVNIEDEDELVTQILYKPKFYIDIYMGCVMCISKKILEIFKEMNCNYVGYDGVCAHIALMNKGMYVLNKTIVYHRLHGENATSTKMGNNFGTGSLEKRTLQMKEDIRYFQTLGEQTFITSEENEGIQNYVKCLKMRYEFLTKKNYINYMRNACFIRGMIPMARYWGDYAYVLGLQKQLGKVGNMVIKQRNRKII